MESSNGPKSSSAVQEANTAVSAFKRAQTRYRRRGDAPDRTDDVHELVDFNRGTVNRTRGSAPDNHTDDTDACTNVPQQETEKHHHHEDNHVDYQSLIEEVRIPDCVIDRPDLVLPRYYKGPLFTLKGMSGFYYAPQALSRPLQMALAHAAVGVYCEPPHVTNMDGLFQTSRKGGESDDNQQAETSSLWDLWKNDMIERQNGVRTKCNGNSKPNNNTRQASEARQTRSFQKLSWSTMGYHYDWTARSYNENVKSDMPPEIQQLAQLFATTTLLLESESSPEQQWRCAMPPSSSDISSSSPPPPPSSSKLSYTASACIVNFYNHKSLMGGHRDDLELALDKPIVSLSLGRPAIFLLGGHTKDEGPVIPILVRPGDVMIMGGESRLRYHGMARLLPTSCCSSSGARTRSSTDAPAQDQSYQVKIEDVIPSSTMEESTGETIVMDRLEVEDAADNAALQSLQHDEEEMAMVDRFLTQHRININVRQVY